MVGALIFGFMSLLFLFLGVVFRVWKQVELLSGYREEDYEDKDGLANWVGKVFFHMGILSLGAIVPCIWATDPKQGIILGVVYSTFVTIGGCIVMMQGCEKFKKKK